MQSEISRLREELHLAKRAAGAAHGQATTQAQAAEELRLARNKKHRQDVRMVEADAAKSANTFHYERGVLERQRAQLQGKLESQREQLASQVKLVNQFRDRIKLKVLDADVEQQAASQDKLDALNAMARDHEEREQDLVDELAALELQLTEQAVQLKEATAEDAALGKVEHQLEQLRLATGVEEGRSAPPRNATSRQVADRSKKHMVAVLRGRGEGDDINLVADALRRCGYTHRLFEADRFQHAVKAAVKDAMGKLQAHWTPRHAIHLWDRLDLSRAKMETLRHLLSFTYIPATDKYEPIHVWDRPSDASDFVLAPTVASRWPREKLYATLAAEQNIVVGLNGRCERDVIEASSRLYSNYQPALRKVYTASRPAQPILFLDGTGGALGRGICHGELGCADFVAVGDSDAKQSRATLQPVFLYEGSDHTADLRGQLDLV